MRVSIESLYSLRATRRWRCRPTHALRRAPAGVRVATATPAVSPAPKFTFILFWKENNAATQGMTEALKQAVAKRSQRAEWISVNVNDAAQRPLVDRYHVERAPMPMVLCIAPNGAITGGITRQLTDAAIDKALVTPGMTEATKALQDKRIAVIHVKRDPRVGAAGRCGRFYGRSGFQGSLDRGQCRARRRGRSSVRERDGVQAGRAF